MEMDLTRLSWSTLGMLTTGIFTGVVRSLPDVCYTVHEPRLSLPFIVMGVTDKFSSIKELSQLQIRGL